MTSLHKILIGVGIIGLAAWAILTRRKLDVFQSEIPFAKPTGTIWPVSTDDPHRTNVAHRTSGGTAVEEVKEGASAFRHFGASREGGVRYHAGVDLVAHSGDPILAMESGTVLGSIPGYVGLDAVVVDHPSVVAVYAEISPHSLSKAGLHPGDVVEAGTVIGYGATSSGTMLHLELWEKGHAPPSFTVWRPGHPPAGLLDPTAYLLTLRGA